MTYKQAIDTIMSNYPPEKYTILREALDICIELLNEKIDEIDQHCAGKEVWY